MRYSEAEWQAMERRGDLDYADTRPRKPPPLCIWCVTCDDWHPEGFHFECDE